MADTDGSRGGPRRVAQGVADFFGEVVGEGVLALLSLAVFAGSVPWSSPAGRTTMR